MTYKHVVQANQEDDESKVPFFPIDKRKPYKHFEQTLQFQHIHFYISEDIVEPDAYIEMIYRIQNSSPNDTIYIHLNTPGGQLDTGVQIINAIQNSPAKVITVLEGMAYSLGTLIFLAGDELVVNDHCIMMFHNFRGGVVGKGNEITLQLEATVKWFTELAKQIYVPFLSDDEFNRLLKGEDIWMMSEEVRARLENMIKIKSEEKKKSPRKKKDNTPS